MAIKPLEDFTQRIYSLELFIEIEDMYKTRTETLAAAKVLLQPFRRLRNVSNPFVCSVVCSYGQNVSHFSHHTTPKTEADLEFEG
jgi:hypothetical protein